jgi:hypothetical protein
MNNPFTAILTDHLCQNKDIFLDILELKDMFERGSSVYNLLDEALDMNIEINEMNTKITSTLRNVQLLLETQKLK